MGMVGTVSARALVSRKRIGQVTFLQHHFGLAFMEKIIFGRYCIDSNISGRNIRKIQTSHPCKFVHCIASFLCNNEDIISL